MNGNEFSHTKPICMKCKKEMYLDDIDYNFRGNQDNYWQCECGCSALEKIRYGHRIKIKFWDSDGNVIGMRWQ